MFITGFTHDRGACTRLRIYQPLKRIAELGLAETHTLELSDADPDSVVRKSDIAVMGRAAGGRAMEFVTKLQMDGKKVVFDLDDNYQDVTPMSPHYKQLGIMPVNLETEDGRSVNMWEDGKDGFELKKNRQIRRDFAEITRAAACITVTTEPLKKVYQRFNDYVHVVPNAIDFRIWNYMPLKHTGDSIRILYTGAANHQEDFLYIRDPLKEIHEKYRNTTIVFVGTDWRHLRSNLDYDRVEVHPWVDFSAYPYLLKSLACHIGLAPITESDFNNCRSALKWMEYSALKIPTVASDFGPYKRKMKDGETGLLVTEQDEWFKAMSLLIENEDMRENLGGNAYREVKARFNLDFVVDKWMSVYNTIITKEK